MQTEKLDNLSLLCPFARALWFDTDLAIRTEYYISPSSIVPFVNGFRQGYINPVVCRNMSTHYSGCSNFGENFAIQNKAKVEGALPFP